MLFKEGKKSLIKQFCLLISFRYTEILFLQFSTLIKPCDVVNGFEKL